MANISHDLFATLKDLWVPAKIQDQPFEQIQATLRKQYSYRRNAIVERYRLHKLHQTELQSTTDFVRVLRRQVRKCDFGQSIDMLRYQLVVGVSKEDVRRTLLANEK